MKKPTRPKPVKATPRRASVRRTSRRSTGLMPLEITASTKIENLSSSERLGYLRAVIQTKAGAGPQALEGYTLVDHPAGRVDLAMGTIGNVEVHGAGTVGQVRSLQGGGVVTGPATIEQWAALVLTQPKAGGGYTGPVNVQEVAYIVFDNGWSIRPEGDRLLLCDPKGNCRDL